MLADKSCTCNASRTFGTQHRDRQQARLLSVSLPAAAASLGETLRSVALEAVGVTVVSVRRSSGAVGVPHESLVLSAGDTLVLSGLPGPLALAEKKLLGSG